MHIFRQNIISPVYDALRRNLDVRKLLRKSQTGHGPIDTNNYNWNYIVVWRVVFGYGGV